MLSFIQSPIFIALLSLSLSAFAAGAVFKARGHRNRIFWSVVLLCGLLFPCRLGAALCPWLVDPRYRAYREFFKGIEVGMNRSEVFGLRDRVYPTGGERATPRLSSEEDEKLVFLMNPEGPREPNAEAIVVVFKEGRVASKRYHSD